MFSCNRMMNNLIISVDFRAAIAFLLGVSLFFLFSIWMFWFVALRIEIRHIRKELYSALSQTMGSVIEDNFSKNHVTLLQYEECMTERHSCEAVNRDLARMMDSKQKEEDKPKEVVRHGRK